MSDYKIGTRPTSEQVEAAANELTALVANTLSGLVDRLDGVIGLMADLPTFPSPRPGSLHERLSRFNATHLSVLMAACAYYQQDLGLREGQQ